MSQRDVFYAWCRKRWPYLADFAITMRLLSLCPGYKYTQYAED